MSCNELPIHPVELYVGSTKTMSFKLKGASLSQWQVLLEVEKPDGTAMSPAPSVTINSAAAGTFSFAWQRDDGALPDPTKDLDQVGTYKVQITLKDPGGTTADDKYEALPPFGIEVKEVING